MINITEETKRFIETHRNEDVRALALKAHKSLGVDLTFALEQIAGWQKARTKLPEWARTEGIIYPPHISMEQCSSEKTALYKAETAVRLAQEAINNDKEEKEQQQEEAAIKEKTVLTDLTGGFGVDFSYMARGFGRAVYVERQSHLCELAGHNFGVMGISNAEVVNGDSEAFLGQMEAATVIFADPARRDSHGGRAFAIADCTPDVHALKELLLEKGRFVMLKLSPMLDWRKAVSDFGGCAGEVHIVSADNECKELLLVLSARFNGLRRIFCVSDGGTLSYTPEEAAAAQTMPCPAAGTAQRLIGMLRTGAEAADCRLYEPNPAVMKAGCFALIAARYGAEEVGRNSHLFLSEGRISGFPGRGFRVRAVSTMNKRELKAALSGITKANISMRNFPMAVAELRRRLKIADGGGTYIFATTADDGTHLLIICEKEDGE